MKYKIDVVRIRENSIQLNGWVIGKTPESRAEFEVLDQNRRTLDIKYVAVSYTHLTLPTTSRV